MSDIAVSALAGAAFTGIVSVSEAGLRGMVTLKADLEAAAVKKAVKKLCGTDVPAVRRVAAGPEVQVAWMAPDELLILCDHAKADAMVADLAAALAGHHHLAVNVSDARAMFELSGDAGAVRDVLAKITPADMRPDVLVPGEMRRTRIAQIPAALWFETEGKAFVICFRSVAQYAFDLLSTSAKPGGEVGYF